VYFAEDCSYLIYWCAMFNAWRVAKGDNYGTQHVTSDTCTAFSASQKYKPLMPGLVLTQWMGSAWSSWNRGLTCAALPEGGVTECYPERNPDCAGAHGGPGVMKNGECCASGVFDQCGVCDGADECVDCAGIVDGTTVEDCAGVCGGDAVVDCNDDCGGAAVMNADKSECCVTGQLVDGQCWEAPPENADCNGVANGPGVELADGSCCASGYLDPCGVCDGWFTCDLDTMDLIKAWCDQGFENCMACKGKTVVVDGFSSCKVKERNIVKCKTFKKYPETCDRVAGCKAKQKARRGGKVLQKCKGGKADV